MPQYLISVLDDTTGSGTREEMAAIDEFNEHLQAQGHWVFAGGLAAPAAATVIDARSSGTELTDGPFIESKEYMAGLWIVEADDAEAALRLASLGSEKCNRRVELRPFM